MEKKTKVGAEADANNTCIDHAPGAEGLSHFRFGALLADVDGPNRIVLDARLCRQVVDCLDEEHEEHNEGPPAAERRPVALAAIEEVTQATPQALSEDKGEGASQPQAQLPAKQCLVPGVSAEHDAGVADREAKGAS